MCDTDFRLVLCPTCGSEGVLIFAYRNDPDNERYEDCPECHGACDTLIQVEPIEIEDLDIMSGSITEEVTAT